MKTNTKVKTKIRVQVKNVFGNDLIYPMCINSKRFTDLTNSKTLSRHNIKLIKELGFEVDVVTPEL